MDQRLMQALKGRKKIRSAGVQSAAVLLSGPVPMALKICERVIQSFWFEEVTCADTLICSFSYPRAKGMGQSHQNIFR